MCIAAVIYDDLSLADLQNMEDHNPHGGGVAYLNQAGTAIRYRKGLTAREVWDLQGSMPRPYLLHFRWTTHGPTVKRLAHPFPLGHAAFSPKLKGSAPAVMIHNGVWSNYASFAPKGLDLNQHSDTQVAAWRAGRDESILDQVDWATAVARVAGTPEDPIFSVTCRGRWMLDNRKGQSTRNLYSNTSWTRPVSRGNYYYVQDWGRPKSEPRHETMDASEWLRAYESRMAAKHERYFPTRDKHDVGQEARQVPERSGLKVSEAYLAESIDAKLKQANCEHGACEVLTPTRYGAFVKCLGCGKRFYQADKARTEAPYSADKDGL